MSAEKPRRGRPPVSEQERLTWVTTMRLTTALGAAIQNRAKQTGMTTNAVIRQVLEAEFQTHEKVKE
jgi:predicted DNA binding CopG/RHH family protein